METSEQIERLTNLYVYPLSLTEAGGITYFLGRRGVEKFVGSVGVGGIIGKNVGELDGKAVIAGPTDHANALAIRKNLPWTGPRCLGPVRSIGMGDRLGLATPGQIRAVQGKGLAVFLAQQSIREMVRTHRSPDDVMDSATWGVLQEGFKNGFGSDADHLQTFEDIDRTVEAGFTMFTIDPGAYVDDAADTAGADALTEKVAEIPPADMETTIADMTGRYVGKTLDLGKGQITFDEETLFRAAAKYGKAVVQVAKMYRHLTDVARGPVEVEISVDETESPSAPAEHFFFATELKRLGVEWVALAPRFVGRFEKGVDYIGDLDEFAASFAEHVAVMKALGPYRISIHSGSDKFSIYPIAADLAGQFVHVKTAGTSYLEALRAIAATNSGLFREILDFARGRYETDKATYHVSADVTKVPSADTLKNEQLPGLLDEFNARQVLHVTFGSVLTADDGKTFGSRIYAALKADEEAHYAALEKHLARHISPLAR
ncbi:MAG: tagaturonate epimerase family protein [Planctomycetota bacterium]|nr:tagaturonate epimerase family protein [Planctomycetota bacterium]